MAIAAPDLPLKNFSVRNAPSSRRKLSATRHGTSKTDYDQPRSPPRAAPIQATSPPSRVGLTAFRNCWKGRSSHQPNTKPSGDSERHLTAERAAQRPEK